MKLMSTLKKSLSFEVVQSCGVERSLIGFNHYQPNGSRSDLDSEVALSPEKTLSPETKEFGNDLLQFEISAMEKQVVLYYHLHNLHLDHLLVKQKEN